MATPVLILGHSGTGKSTSMRNFGDKDIAVVSVNGKRLPFRNRFEYVLNSDDYSKILAFMKEKASKVKTIVVDDSQYLMANEFMRRTKETGFQKYTEIGRNFWGLIKAVEKLPEDVTVYFLHHPETGDDGVQKAKTIGKLLDDKITVEGMFTIVLRTMVVDKEYLFSTQTDGTDPCKTPMGMFSANYIPNDLKLVDDTIREYYGLTNSEPTEESIANDEITSSPQTTDEVIEDIFADVDEPVEEPQEELSQEELQKKAADMFKAIKNDKELATKVREFVKDNGGSIPKLSVESLKEVIALMS